MSSIEGLLLLWTAFAGAISRDLAQVPKCRDTTLVNDVFINDDLNPEVRKREGISNECSIVIRYDLPTHR